MKFFIVAIAAFAGFAFAADGDKCTAISGGTETDGTCRGDKCVISIPPNEEARNPPLNGGCQ